MKDFDFPADILRSEKPVVLAFRDWLLVVALLDCLTKEKELAAANPLKARILSQVTRMETK